MSDLRIIVFRLAQLEQSQLLTFTIYAQQHILQHHNYDSIIDQLNGLLMIKSQS